MRPPLRRMIATVGFMLVALVTQRQMIAQELSLAVKAKEVRKVVSDGRHNAFAAFSKWKGHYWLAFRQATGHVSRDGDLVVLRSPDTRKWDRAAKFDVAGDDRDAQLLPTENRLFLYINSLHDGRFDVFVSYTDDGETWSKPRRIYRPGFILWKPVRQAGKFYAGAHRPASNNRRESHLVVSSDGIEWRKVSTIRAGQGESETTLLFAGDRKLTAFMRSQINVGGAILESAPPYKEWKQRPARIHLSGHAVYTFDGVSYLIGRYLGYDPAVDSETPRAKVAGRKLDQATMVYTYERGQLKPYCLLGALDGNRDNSYATAVREGQDMLIVYHRAAHEFAGAFRAKDAADLYLARVPLKK